MKKQWILVANGSLARLFIRSAEGDPLVAIETIDFPGGRLKGRELERDRQGHERSDNSSAATHFEPHTSTRKKMLNQFARELVERLEKGLSSGEFDVLWLIASSPFLGELKAALTSGIGSRVNWVHEADFTRLDARTLESRLQRLHPKER